MGNFHIFVLWLNGEAVISSGTTFWLSSEHLFFLDNQNYNVQLFEMILMII